MRKLLIVTLLLFANPLLAEEPVVKEAEGIEDTGEVIENNDTLVEQKAVNELDLIMERLEVMTPRAASKIVAAMPADLGAKVILAMPAERGGKVLQWMRPHQAARILQFMDQREETEHTETKKPNEKIEKTQKMEVAKP